MSKTDEPGRVPKRQKLSHEKQIEMAQALQEQGHNVAKIAYVMRLKESAVRTLLLNLKQNMWYPGDDYEPRAQGKYTQMVGALEPGEVVFLVRGRVQKDLVYAAPNGFMGEEKEKMRELMAFCINHQTITHILFGIAEAGEENERTVDWVCRELGKRSRGLLK